MGWNALSLSQVQHPRDGRSVPDRRSSGGQRLAIADLDLGDAQIRKFTKGGRAYVSIRNVGVTLNATAMGAINSTFGVPFPTTSSSGTANVLARVAR